MHILPNILKSKGNQIMKFDQLIEYNLTNSFLENSDTKCGGKTSPRSFYGKLKVRYLWINSLKFYTIIFTVY